MTNNDIIKKLRVALKLRNDDIIEILKLVDYDISKSELGAFFRREDHPNYMELKDQILRNFLNGLVIYKRGPMERKKVDGKDKDSIAKSSTTIKDKGKNNPKKRIVSFKKES